MKVEKIKLNQLKKADYNPGEILPGDYLKLKKSMENFGLIEPIVYHRKTRTIIDGHHRYDALTEKGVTDANELILGDIGWVFTDEDIKVKDENDIKAMNLALRKLRGTFNQLKLTDLFSDLAADDYDLSLTGFNNLEIEDILRSKTYESPTPVAPGDDDYNNDVDYYNDDYNDIESEWEGMPEFKQEDQRGYKIVVHFDSLEDLYKLVQVWLRMPSFMHSKFLAQQVRLTW